MHQLLFLQDSHLGGNRQELSLIVVRVESKYKFVVLFVYVLGITVVPQMLELIKLI